MTASDVKAALQKHASDMDAANLQWFFKTAPGEYGEGDQFIGVRVPAIRSVCKEYKALPLGETQKLIESPIHEHRMAGLIILTLQYPKSSDKQAIYDLYVKELKASNINNWNLVDVTCRAVVGEHTRHNRAPLYTLAKSDNLWERRTSIIATFPFIAAGDPTTTMDLAEQLLYDTHDLMQKAVGWSLREVGKRCDQQLLLDFLDTHAATMPRTTLRYTIEHLTPLERTHYMQAKSRV
jgi:3-methyladenine DNA glycosylase AlkD